MFPLFLFKAPSGYPSQLQIIEQTPLTVTFRWNELACHEENGPITGYQYRVYYDLEHYYEGIVDRRTTMVTLSYNNMQSFSVAAKNEAGNGEYCAPILVPYINEGDEMHMGVRSVI